MKAFYLVDLVPSGLLPQSVCELQPLFHRLTRVVTVRSHHDPASDCTLNPLHHLSHNRMGTLLPAVDSSSRFGGHANLLAPGSDVTAPTTLSHDFHQSAELNRLTILSATGGLSYNLQLSEPLRGVRTQNVFFCIA